jgi:Flp pilus assembly protein TadG
VLQRPRRNCAGQATVEFALISPLIVLCLYLIVGTTASCLQVLHLHDIARGAARTASTSGSPNTAAQDFAQSLGTTATVVISPDQQFVSVTVHKTFQATSIKAWFTPLPLHATVTMMLEPQMVLE